MAHTTYHRGDSWPHEAFVQRAIEVHFAAQGFHLEPPGEADLVCMHPVTGEVWVVEAKGVTAAVGLDLDVGVGQLLRRMQHAEHRYAIALPDVPAYHRACARLPRRVRKALGIHWLVVDETGSVRLVGPDETDLHGGY